MRVTWARRGRSLHFRAYPDADDRPTSDGAQRLVRPKWFVRVPDRFDLEATHPDLVALAALLVVHPFVGSRIEFPTGVSKGFAEATGYGAGPIDPMLDPRSGGSRPGLAYSGGVDSTAALTVMPDATVSVFLQRALPTSLKAPDRILRTIGRGSKYRADAALHAVTTVAHSRTALALLSDLEFTRRPVGFPVDLATAVPAILAADHFDLGSIAWGTVLESTYRVGHARFEDYRTRWHWTHWSRLFETAGLPMNQVTAGLSEVATTAISLRSPFGSVASSCARGEPGVACLACWKCLRKTLIERAVVGIEPSSAELDRLFSSPDAAAGLRMVPIKHENVLAFATSRYTGDHDVMRLLRERTRGDRLQVDWMRRWYSPAADLLPASSRPATIAAITSRVEPMTTDDEAQTRAWDLDAAMSTETYRAAARRLNEALT